MLIGITQGVVMSVLLFRSKNNKRSNPFLALALLAFCWVSTKTLLHTLHLWDTQFFRFFPNSADVVIAPLVYLYFSSLVDARFKFSREHIIHFIPFILLQTYMVVVYFSLIGTADFAEKDRVASGMHFNLMKDVESYMGLLSVGLYLFLSFKKLKKYRQWLSNVTSDSTFPDFNWLRRVLFLSLLIGVFLFFNFSADILFQLKQQTDVHWSAFSLFIAFSVYYLGVAGYQQPDYELSVEREPLSPILVEDVHQVGASRISSSKSDEVVRAIKHALEVDRVFLNPTLSIQELSRKLNIPQQEVSQVINASFQKKFRDLINEYRIEEVKSMLMRDDIEHMSILGIALDCGFNSEATFYRIFKKNTGISPKEYIQLALKS